MDSKKYYDSNNKEYKVGDIVFNPFFGDYWLVEEYTEEEQSETDCPYCLSLYGDKDDYYMDIDEPAGFIIICSKNELHIISFPIVHMRNINCMVCFAY